VQYVWDIRYLDSPICRFRDANDDWDADGDGEKDPGSDGLEETLYYLTDANHNVTALVEPNGNVVERYLYDAYGRVHVLNGAADPDGAVLAEWTLDPDNVSDWSNEILYAGYRHDPETLLYHVRHRYLHATLGRWLTSDPKGYVDGMSFYEYCRTGPIAAVDPMGLRSETSKTWRGRKRVGRCVEPGTFYQVRHYHRMFGWFGPKWLDKVDMVFVPDRASNLGVLAANGMADKLMTGSIEAGRASEKIGERADQAAGAVVTIYFVATIVVPGPDDAIWGAVGARVFGRLAGKGIKMVRRGRRWVFSRGGRRLTGKALNEAQELALDALKAERTARRLAAKGDEILDVGKARGGVERAARGVASGSNEVAHGGRVASRAFREFDVLDYRTTVVGLREHHGVLDKWATANVEGYVRRGARTPAILLTPKQHDAANAVYRSWLKARTGKGVGGTVDWTSVGAHEVGKLTEEMFEAAGVPEAARRAYYRRFHKYIYSARE